LDEASWLMICGSLPPGVPATFYARLIELARERGVKTLLDTDGAPLDTGIKARPTVVTPTSRKPSGCWTPLLSHRARLSAPRSASAKWAPNR